MASSKVIGPYQPFDFGSPVRWRRKAECDVEGSICGFREVDDEQIAAELSELIGTVLVLIETSTGESFEVPLTELELI